jgi:hypothetical protein
MYRPTTIGASLRQRLSNLASPAAPSFSSTPATFSPTSMGPAKKRGLLASWLRTRNSEDDTAGYSGAGGKGKEREWDAGELNEEMQRVMNAIIFNGGLDFECVQLCLPVPLISHEAPRISPLDDELRHL